MSDLNLKAVAIANDGLRKKIDAAVRAAWLNGKDFMHGPAVLQEPDFFAPFDIARPVTYALEVSGGPIERGQREIPAGWSVYRCPDMSEGERLRFAAGRRDWRDEKWQDHCGDPNCSQCTGFIP